jgi:hypothetical protein
MAFQAEQKHIRKRPHSDHIWVFTDDGLLRLTKKCLGRIIRAWLTMD